MKIKKRRIRNIWAYLNLFKKGEDFFVGLRDLRSPKKQLKKIGFSKDLQDGEQILPSALGPVSTYNACGKNIVRRDLPMETAYRQVEWHWKDWGGYDHSKIVDVPYARYPREFVTPPSEEIQIVVNNNEIILLSKILQNTESKEEEIIHIVNLFLELFGECELLKKNLIPPVRPQIIRLNWKVLPPGEYPWERVKKHVKNVIHQQSKGNQPVIRHRIETITNYNPDFVAIGKGGFNGYLI